jgi:hypothetical protein
MRPSDAAEMGSKIGRATTEPTVAASFLSNNEPSMIKFDANG